jgi:hypothetical protein
VHEVRGKIATGTTREVEVAPDGTVIAVESTQPPEFAESRYEQKWSGRSSIH